MKNEYTIKEITLPQSFVNQMILLLENEADSFFEALQGEAISSIRVNESKKKSEENKPNGVPWCSCGEYLDERPKYVLDPLFHAGAYYVQEASSMFLSHVIDSLQPDRNGLWLDLCAAPGGKSTLIASKLDGDGILFSNEIVKKRALILAENIAKWGNDRVAVTCNSPQQIRESGLMFDLIVADVPCSGEGMFRKDPNAITEWSPENVTMCAERQKQILADIWETLTPGGHLIYSTCTYNLQENEEIMEWLTTQYAAEIIPINVPETWNITQSKYKNIAFNRFYPHKTRGEGFSLCVVKKSGESHWFKSKPEKSKKSVKVPPQISASVQNAQHYDFEERNEIWRAIHKKLSTLLHRSEKLWIIQAGIPIGQMKGENLVYEPEFAFYPNANNNALPKIEVSLPMALRYMKRENIALDLMPKGWFIITYNNINIGLAKNAGSRMNNYFPNNWRIRMDIG